MKSKIFNYRPFVLIFACAIAGILASNYFYTNTILAVVILGIVLSLVIFYSVKHKRKTYAILGIFSLVISIFLMLFRINLYYDDVEIKEGSCVKGTIEKIYNQYNNSVVLSDITINDKEYKSNIILFSYGDELLFDNVDNKISFEVVNANKINKLDTSNELLECQNMDDNITYYLTCNEVEILNNNQSLRTKLQNKVKTNLNKCFNNENAELMFSSLFGIKYDLNKDLYNSFISSQLVHVLAVSGLHVGIIVACLYFLLKLFKVNNLARTIICSLFLLAYSYMCNWSYSVVRASIMALVIMFSKLSNREYDALSSISLAGIIILAISPTALFDISFLLGYMCVLSIAMFFKPACKLLKKWRIQNKITETMAISSITTLSIFLVMAYFFQSVNFIGILSNVIFLPIYSFIFALVFFVSILSLILPFIIHLLVPFDWILNIVVSFIKLLGSFAITFTTNKIAFLSIILYAVGLMVISKYSLMKKTNKLLSFSIICALICVSNVVYSINFSL